MKDDNMQIDKLELKNVKVSLFAGRADGLGEVQRASRKLDARRALQHGVGRDGSVQKRGW